MGFAKYRKVYLPIVTLEDKGFYALKPSPNAQAVSFILALMSRKGNIVKDSVPEIAYFTGNKPNKTKIREGILELTTLGLVSTNDDGFLVLSELICKP